MRLDVQVYTRLSFYFSSGNKKSSSPLGGWGRGSLAHAFYYYFCI